MQHNFSSSPSSHPGRYPRSFIFAMAAAGSASGYHRVQPIDADTAKVMVTEQMARAQNLAMEVIAQRSALEKTALRELRAKYPGITTDELVRIWIDRLTGRSPSDITDALGDEVEEMATAASNKVTSYLQLLAQNESTTHRDNCLACTFCGAWFPDFWLLDLMPQGSPDWRRQYFRCCYQCASGENDDLYWHPSHPTLSPALHRQPGTAVSVGRTDYDHQQRQPVANLDADYRQQPSPRCAGSVTMSSPKRATSRAPVSWTSRPGATSARKSAP